MSKLMSVLGIMLLAVGAALALVGFVDPAQMDIYGIKMDTAAILLTGGILSIGLGGVIDALQGTTLTATVAKDVVIADVSMALPKVSEVKVPEVETKPVDKAVEEPVSRVRFNPFARKTETVAAGAATAAAAVVVAEAVQNKATTAVAVGKSSVDDTIAALEQAKADIANAIGGVSTIGDEKVDTDAPDEDASDEDDGDAADGELYVIEEREIRGRPARILSDNTVEAETDEGWMRFENIEHLNEYLDSMGESV
jgi:hypothetical protein